MTSTPSTPGADAEETLRHIRELSEQAIEFGKQNGLAWLSAYEQMLEGFLRLQQQAAAGTQVEWVTTLVNTNADIVREVSQAYLSTVREQLK